MAVLVGQKTHLNKSIATFGCLKLVLQAIKGAHVGHTIVTECGTTLILCALPASHITCTANRKQEIQHKQLYELKRNETTNNIIKASKMKQKEYKININSVQNYRDVNKFLADQMLSKRQNQRTKHLTVPLFAILTCLFNTKWSTFGCDTLCQCKI